MAERVTVAEVLRSRYTPGKRPVRWDERFAGAEVVRSTDDREVLLFSNGGQSSPAAGWELLLTQPRGEASWEWTLYGIKPSRA
jgi:hypothetical protein